MSRLFFEVIKLKGNAVCSADAVKAQQFNSGIISSSAAIPTWTTQAPPFAFSFSKDCKGSEIFSSLKYADLKLRD